MSRLFIALAACGLATSAMAQTGSNVVPPRAESQVGGINQSMTTQQQNREVGQQNQFENNALRSQLSQPTPPPISPYNSGTTGSIRR